MAGFLSKSKLKASQIIEQSVQFLVSKFEQASHVFTPASPFGQLLIVISNIAELIFTYLAHATEELNIHTAQNVESIHGLARLTGHDAFRGQAARGICQLKLNQGAADKVNGAYIKIKNGSKFTVEQGNSTYFLDVDNEYLTLHIDDNDYTTVHFIQGEKHTQVFTSNGEPLQSFNPVVAEQTDHDYVKVYVNGQEWEKVDSLYDMVTNGEQYMVKSSINVGLTIFFGNGYYGKIPTPGSEIVVEYIITDGIGGNLNTTNLSYRFQDSATDEFGNDIDLNDVLQVITVRPPIMGTDFENPEFTKLVAPHASKSFVLATPENYVSYLSRYNQFAFVDAYNTKDDEYVNDDNITYINILPDVKRKFTTDVDYFSLDENEFKLSEDEKRNIALTLEDSGRMLVNSEVVINDLEIKHFVINVIIRYFEGFNKVELRTKIREIFNQYFLNINRRDIIPLSDLIALVERVDGVDTCVISFITQDNEEAILNGYYTKKIDVWDPNKLMYVKEDKMVRLTGNLDPQIGLDDFGNIVVDRGVLMIPRGGWCDRNGNYYEEIPSVGQLGPLNIFFTDEVESRTYNINQQKRFNNLLKKYTE